MKLWFIFSVLFMMVSLDQLWALPQSILIEESTSLVSEPLFGRDNYHIGKLNPGAEGEIVSVSTNHLGGVALQVRVSNGANQGQLGWVYLSSDQAQRKFKLLDEKNKEVSLPNLPTGLTESEDDKVLANLGTIKRVNNPTNEFKRAFFPLTQSMGSQPKSGIYSKEPELVSVKSDKEIWDDFSKGKLTLDDQSYKGGNLFTFTDNQGQKKYSAAFRTEYYEQLPETIQEIVKVDPDCIEDFPEVQRATPKSREWLPGCEVLEDSINSDSKQKLELCLNSIKRTLSGGKKLTANDRLRLFPLFYSKLNPTEQEFMAHIVTSIGEAGVLAPPLEEMIAVMMILENRKEYAKGKGFHNANALDAALQPSQFSMYDKDAHHWSNALNRPPNDGQTQHALDAFIKFKNTKFTSEQRKIFHYHTDSVHPKWKSPSKVVPIILNGVSLKTRGKRHIFYKNIGWSFRNNPWSKK